MEVMKRKGLLSLLLFLVMITGTACAGKKEAQMNAYKDIMVSLLEKGVLTVDGKDYISETFQSIITKHPEYNSFVVTDIDDDGSEELIISFENLSLANDRMYVFDYREERGVYCEAEFFYKNTTFYEKGAKVNSPRNQSPSRNIGPYALYKYNSEDDRYEFTGYVNEMASEICEQSTIWEFPLEYDQDKDGLVYKLSLDNQSSDPITVDNAEYEKWRDAIVDEGTKKDPAFLPLTEENVKDAF